MAENIYSLLKNIYYFHMPPILKYHTDGFIQHVHRIQTGYFSRVGQELSMPKEIQIQTTSFCNATCRICPYVSLKKDLSQGIMSRELFDSIIDQCAESKISEIYLHLMNEPLMDKRLPELISYVKDKIPFSTVSINTNASLLDKKFGRELIDSGLDRITFSIHGWTDASYKTVMGLEFNSVYNNILNFIAMARAGDLDISLNCVWTKYFTLRDYIAAYRFSQKNKLLFFLWRPFNRAGNINFRYLEEMGIEKIKKKKLKMCLQENRPFRIMHILYNGQVVTCCMDWARELVLGDTNLQTLSSIWKGDSYRILRDKISGRIETKDDFICKRCSEAA